MKEVFLVSMTSCMHENETKQDLRLEDMRQQVSQRIPLKNDQKRKFTGGIYATGMITLNPN